MSGFTFFSLPEIPNQVDISDLHDGLLITQEQLNSLINNTTEFQKDGRYSKTVTNVGYGVIRHEDKFYVVYKGAKHQKALGQGANGSAKIVQYVGAAKPEAESNMKVGEFYALKLTKNEKDAANEHGALKAVNQTTSSPLTPRKFKSDRSELQKLFTHQASLKNLGVLIDPGNPPTPPTPRTNEILNDKAQIIMQLISGVSIEKFIALELAHVSAEYDKEYEKQLSANKHDPDFDPEVIMTPDDFLINPALRIQLFISTLEAIEELHTKYKMLHRDVHPGNVLIDRAKQKACLIDYGFALKFLDLSSATTLAKLKAATSYVPELRVKLNAKLDALAEEWQLQEDLKKFINEELHPALMIKTSSPQEKSHLEAKLRAFIVDNLTGSSKQAVDLKFIELCSAAGMDFSHGLIIATELEALRQSGECDPDVVVSTKAEAYTAGYLGAVMTHLSKPSLDAPDSNNPPDPNDPRTWSVSDNGIFEEIDESFMCLPEKESKSIHAILHKLAAQEPMNRCTFKEAIAQLKVILKNYIKENNIKLRSGVLNVEEYLSLDKTKKQALITEAQKFDEIWLIDTNLKRPDQLTTYLQVKREIGLLTPKQSPDDKEKLGVAIGDKVAVGEDIDKMLVDIQTDLNKRPVPAVCERLSLKLSLKPSSP